MDTARDTLLDSIAAQARSHPALSIDEVARLLPDAHDHPRGEAEQRLIRHHLSLALDGALAWSDRGLEIGDLYQEASVALVTAVEEYAARSSDAAGLRAYVERVIRLHLEAAVEREAAEREAEEAFVRDAQLLEAVEVELRHRLGRPPTALELAAALEWTDSRVEMVSEMLAEARAIHDEDIVRYLDDLDEKPDS